MNVILSTHKTYAVDGQPVTKRTLADHPRAVSPTSKKNRNPSGLDQVGINPGLSLPDYRAGYSPE